MTAPNWTGWALFLATSFHAYGQRTPLPTRELSGVVTCDGAVAGGKVLIRGRFLASDFTSRLDRDGKYAVQIPPASMPYTFELEVQCVVSVLGTLRSETIVRTEEIWPPSGYSPVKQDFHYTTKAKAERLILLEETWVALPLALIWLFQGRMRRRLGWTPASLTKEQLGFASWPIVFGVFAACFTSWSLANKVAARGEMLAFGSTQVWEVRSPVATVLWGLFFVALGIEGLRHAEWTEVTAKTRDYWINLRPEYGVRLFAVPAVIYGIVLVVRAGMAFWSTTGS